MLRLPEVSDQVLETLMVTPPHASQGESGPRPCHPMSFPELLLHTAAKHGTKRTLPSGGRLATPYAPPARHPLLNSDVALTYVRQVYVDVLKMASLYLVVWVSCHGSGWGQ